MSHQPSSVKDTGRWHRLRFLTSVTRVDRLFVLLLAGGAMTPVRAAPDVPFDRIVEAAAEPGNWLTYSGNYAGHRHSPLRQITPANAVELKPVWVYQARDAGPKWEVTPLVVDGVIYLSERPNVVNAPMS